MGAKLILKNPSDICVSEMKDGQLAVVMEKLDDYKFEVGEIIMRTGRDIRAIGKPLTHCWAGFFGDYGECQEKFHVRILVEGDLLRITREK